MDCNKPKVKTINIADVAVDNLATLPDYFLAERDVEDVATGNITRTPVRVRSSDIFPNANNDNVIALAINNDGITVPENVPDDAKIALANINVYSDVNAQISSTGAVTSLDKGHGVYGHSLNIDKLDDEIFG